MLGCRKGVSSSALPYKRTPPTWLKISAADVSCRLLIWFPLLLFLLLGFLLNSVDPVAQVEENICKFAKKGLSPSQIGVILRDSHGIAQVNSVTGSKILRILKAHGTSLHDVSVGIDRNEYEDIEHGTWRNKLVISLISVIRTQRRRTRGFDPLESMVAAYGAMKPTKLGLEEPQEQLHRIPFTLSSKNVKNPEKGASYLSHHLDLVLIL
ncbi:hypothetical protein GW17_00005031 [Ensete ventricosum]|nr:hypothetical protein GW17_00005031 [Ensete ventricosum]